MNKVILIVGPTASGKTGISTGLALHTGSEIINADSMQIYSEMIIGTARPTEEEQRGIPHHLFGFVRPDSPYNVSIYQKDAFSIIDSLHEKEIVPIVVGGTGLYINSLIYKLDFSSESDTELRRELEDIYDSENGPERLFEKLRDLDPESASRIHINDRKRVIRRLEILSTHNDSTYNFYPDKNDYDLLIIGITKNRDHLYRDIEKRIDIMMAEGLEKEARYLYETYGRDINAFAAIGYKEFIPYFEGKVSLGSVVDDIKKNTRHLAKRQMTWFRKNPDIIWFNTDEYDSHDALMKSVLKITKEFLNGDMQNE
ncbi:MAG: tRNA (adenosine(37)-N6)-dimethylallyltransferase MiaA [Clostridia bacterium]|nr:tRNA (adenosine(37)-N6)-dimethylallyltransferase MiaA [Clostridia bacterium]